MYSLNEIKILGYVGTVQEPKSYGSEGKVLLNFSIATSEKYQDKEITQWHNCVAFGKAAEILAKLISKGIRLFVSGKITYDKYKDKDGVERIGTKIVVQDFIVLTKGVNVNDDNREIPQGKEPILEGGSRKVEEDELPF